VSRRRHPFLNKGPAIGKISRRKDGERPEGEPVFNFEDEDGLLWKKLRDKQDKPPAE
jgi:hypothetical protein